MCCSGGPGGIRLTGCGVICGLAALAALGVALSGPTWLHTEEKLTVPDVSKNSAVSVKFKLGLFRVCSTIVNPSNLTLPFPLPPPCSYVRYSSLEDVKPKELGFPQLEFTPTVVSKIRRIRPAPCKLSRRLLKGSEFNYPGSVTFPLFLFSHWNGVPPEQQANLLISDAVAAFCTHRENLRRKHGRVVRRKG
ncbi:hypothetical protein ALC53_04440 [Atta colombica]|uniref:Uncharacterized protein n=1 Tax=Atta colombica TaxID=520822 RepID=A0A195BLL4_9HYME|nr:hypothetical protein ALC53_04440 [Atta colombica]